jgi:hypothetical protein
MLHVTNEARSELHGMLQRLLEANAHPSPGPGLGFRLVVEKSRLALALDSPRGGDEVVEEEGLSVLILDRAISEFVDDLTLDVVEGSEGTRLELRDRR